MVTLSQSITFPPPSIKVHPSTGTSVHKNQDESTVDTKGTKATRRQGVYPESTQASQSCTTHLDNMPNHQLHPHLIKARDTLMSSPTIPNSTSLSDLSNRHHLEVQFSSRLFQMATVRAPRNGQHLHSMILHQSIDQIPDQDGCHQQDLPK